jgi:hypothetical protein
MKPEEIILSYNIDEILNLYELIKEMSVYSLIMDLNTKSSDFINVILDNVGYYDTIHEPDDGTTDNDYNYDS